MEKNRGPLVIFGDQDFAQLAYEYFTVDSGYEVVGFAVDAAHRKSDTLCGLPVVAFIRPDGTVHAIHGGWFGAAAPAQNKASITAILNRSSTFAAGADSSSTLRR